jgi:hypothetical protein
MRVTIHLRWTVEKRNGKGVGVVPAPVYTTVRCAADDGGIGGTRMRKQAVCSLALLAALACSEESVVSGGPEFYYPPAETVEAGTGDGVIIVPPDVRPEDAELPDFGGPDLDLRVPDTGDSTEEDPLPVEPVDVPDGQIEPDVTELPEVVDVPDVPEVVEVKPEVEEVTPDSSCVPSCKNKECGSDGCDGVCGYCAYGEVCNLQGQCIANKCEPMCSAEIDGGSVTKQCGPDTCGGYCGICMGDGESCGKDGFCYGAGCQGNCKDKECGSDGCGGPCGYCKPDELCDEKGQCGPHPCGDVTSKGKCLDQYTLVQCIDLAPVQTNCKSIEGHMCGWNKGIAKFECVPEKACEPSCAFDDGEPKECGPDGCWGTCGVCPLGWGCGGGLCKPSEGAECAWINNMAGACIADVRWFCSAGKLYSIDCQEQGKKCSWNKDFNFGQGGYDCI